GLFRATPLAHEPIAENVLLGDDGEVGRLEAFLDTEYGEGRLVRTHRLNVGEALDLHGILQSVVFEQRDETLTRAGRPARKDDAPVIGMNAPDMGDSRIENVRIRIGALCRERATALAVHLIDVRLARIVEWRQARNRARIERSLPVLTVEEHL